MRIKHLLKINHKASYLKTILWYVYNFTVDLIQEKICPLMRIMDLFVFTKKTDFG